MNRPCHLRVAQQICYWLTRSPRWVSLRPTLPAQTQVYYRPLGTVLACVSWNYGFHNLISPILAALFSGNTIVLKCSEQVAWSSMWFAGGLRACLRACGLDEEVLQLVVALPEVAETVTRNPLIRHVTCESAQL